MSRKSCVTVICTKSTQLRVQQLHAFIVYQTQYRGTAASVLVCVCPSEAVAQNSRAKLKRNRVFNIFEPFSRVTSTIFVVPVQFLSNLCLWCNSNKFEAWNRNFCDFETGNGSNNLEVF